MYKLPKELLYLIDQLINDKEFRSLVLTLCRDRKIQRLVTHAANDVSIKALALMLVELFQKHSEYRGNFEGVFQALLSKPNLVLIISLSRWLSNQPKEFHSRIENLLSRDELINIFPRVLYEWGNQMTLEYAISGSCIREVYAAELFPKIGEISIPVGVIHEESPHFNHSDMIYVCAIPAVINARNIFEFGTYRGQATCGLASISDDVRVFTLNLPPEQDSRYAPYIGQFIKKFPNKERIIQLFADSKNLDTSPYSKKMDYIFIDADHSYECVKNDTAKALEMLRPGGVIVWHDYAAKTPGVYRFIQEFSRIKAVFRIRSTCLIVFLDGIDVNSYKLSPMPDSLELAEYTPDGVPINKDSSDQYRQ